MKKTLALVLVCLLVVSCFALTACKKKKPSEEGPATYTYNSATNSLPTSWNSHTYQSNTSTLVLDYTEVGFYSFDYNDTMDGYVIVPEMAKSMPIDVTSDYVGSQWGIEEGEVGRVYKIELREDLKFDNGREILASEFVESVKLLLNPAAANYRADSVYSGNLKLANAQEYAKGGTFGTYSEFVSAAYGDEEYIDPDEFGKDAEGNYTVEGKGVIVLDINNGGNWSSNSLMDYADAGYFEDYDYTEDGYMQYIDAEGKVHVLRKNDAEGKAHYWLTDKETVIYRDAAYGFYYDEALTQKCEFTIVNAKLVNIPCWQTLLDNQEMVNGKPNGLVKMNEVTLKAMQDIIAFLHGYESVEDYAAPQGSYEELYAAYLIQYWGLALDQLAGNFAAEWEKLSAEDKAELATAEYQVYDGEAWTPATGVTTVEEYVNYSAYGVACYYADDLATTGSAYNDYAYVEFEEMVFFGKVFDVLPFEKVGIFADPENEHNLIIVLEKELTGFYLNYSLTGNFSLVDTVLYKQCESVSAGIYSNSYGTSVETYTGFGPYKLTTFIDGSEIRFEKNEHWYGHGEGVYQTTHINVKQVADEATRLNMFLKGETDAYGLAAADMEEYQSSDYTYYTDGDSTWFVALNPDFGGLSSAQASATPLNEGYTVNKTILTVKEFRQALSFSIDRAAYALALDPLGGTAKALFGNMIISDPENGIAYRTTEQAKDVILEFWGLADQVGEGKTYATKDEAIASITGYDLAGAKELFDKAYEIATTGENPLIPAEAIASGKWEIQIMIGQPGSGSSAYYNNGYELLKKVWTDAVVGTKLEGHLTFRQSQPLGSTSFSDFLKKNTVDVLFGVGWTGSALDPYGLMEAYVSPNYQYDPGWDTSKTMIDIEVDGQILRASARDWVMIALAGEDLEAKVVVDGEVVGTQVITAGTKADQELRLNILAAVEGAVLQQYDMIPINLDSSAALKGMQIKYYTEEYVFGVGRGGIKYMTYHFTDAEWEQFVKENAVDGMLNYK